MPSSARTSFLVPGPGICRDGGWGKGRTVCTAYNNYVWAVLSKVSIINFISLHLHRLKFIPCSKRSSWNLLPSSARMSFLVPGPGICRDRGRGGGRTVCTTYNNYVWAVLSKVSIIDFISLHLHRLKFIPCSKSSSWNLLPSSARMSFLVPGPGICRDRGRGGGRTVCTTYNNYVWAVLSKVSIIDFISLHLHRLKFIPCSKSSSWNLLPSSARMSFLVPGPGICRDRGRGGGRTVCTTYNNYVWAVLSKVSIIDFISLHLHRLKFIPCSKSSSWNLLPSSTRMSFLVPGPGICRDRGRGGGRGGGQGASCSGGRGGGRGASCCRGGRAGTC